MRRYTNHMFYRSINHNGQPDAKRQKLVQISDDDSREYFEIVAQQLESIYCFILQEADLNQLSKYVATLQRFILALNLNIIPDTLIRHIHGILQFLARHISSNCHAFLDPANHLIESLIDTAHHCGLVLINVIPEHVFSLPAADIKQFILLQQHVIHYETTKLQLCQIHGIHSALQIFSQFTFCCRQYTLASIVDEYNVDFLLDLLHQFSDFLSRHHFQLTLDTIRYTLEPLLQNNANQTLTQTWQQAIQLLHDTNLLHDNALHLLHPAPMQMLAPTPTPPHNQHHFFPIDAALADPDSVKLITVLPGATRN